MTLFKACFALAAWVTTGVAAAAGCVTDTTISVVQSVDISGPQRWVGLEFSQGAQLYLRRINRNGGVHGRTVKMNVMDDKFDPKATALNLSAAAAGGCIIFGPLGTAQTLAAAQAAGSVPIIAPLTGTSNVRGATEGKAFFVRGTYNDEVKAIVKHASSLGFKSFALLVPADAFGTPIVPTYQDAIQKHGATSVAVVTVPSVSSTDFSAAVESLSSAKPDVVIAYLSNTFPEFISAYRTAGNGSQVYTISVAYSNRLLESRSEVVRGVGLTQTTPSPRDQTKPIVREFNEEQRIDGAHVPLSFAALEGYIGAKLMVEALRRAGKDPSASAVRNVLREMPPWDVGGFLVPNRDDGSSFVEIGVLDQNGKYRR